VHAVLIIIPQDKLMLNFKRSLETIKQSTTGHMHLVPPQGVTHLSFAEIFGTRKLESLGYRVLFA